VDGLLQRVCSPWHRPYASLTLSRPDTNISSGLALGGKVNDATAQLTREQRSGTNAYDVTYSYDAVGNRLTKLEAGVATSYSYDAANQLNYEYTPSARTTCTYDANGNTALVNAAGALTTTSWDIENRQTAVQLAAGTRTTATYDGDANHQASGLSREREQWRPS
jgi:uncharacterized protein RhaS with RHS repeats